MSATTEQIQRLRRMVAEKTPANGYTDAILRAYIERYAIDDDQGYPPSHRLWDGASYDLDSAAAEIWDEKAAIAVGDINFTADGATFNVEATYDQCTRMAKRYRARRVSGSVTVDVWPKRDLLIQTIGNLPEPGDYYP